MGAEGSGAAALSAAARCSPLQQGAFDDDSVSTSVIGPGGATPQLYPEGGIGARGPMGPHGPPWGPMGAPGAP